VTGGGNQDTWVKVWDLDGDEVLRGHWTCGGPSWASLELGLQSRWKDMCEQGEWDELKFCEGGIRAVGFSVSTFHSFGRDVEHGGMPG